MGSKLFHISTPAQSMIAFLRVPGCSFTRYREWVSW